jgi:hypothetical protein
MMKSDRRDNDGDSGKADLPKIGDSKELILEDKMEQWLEKHKKFPGHRWKLDEKRALQRMFETIDDDGSGEIDMIELADAMFSSGVASTLADVKKLVHEADTDGSGSIEFDEFLVLMKDTKEPTPSSTTSMRAVAKLKKESKKKTGENPLVRLQNVQKEAGEIDMKTVLGYKRRQLLLDATVGESKRRNETQDKCFEWRDNANNLEGEEKLKVLRDIRITTNFLDEQDKKASRFVSDLHKVVISTLAAASLNPDN